MPGRPVSHIHYTELQAGTPGSPIEEEWETYRCEVGRLLAEGHEGKFALIKGNEIIGIFETAEQAKDEGRKRYLLSGYIVQPIRTWEPVVWVGWRWYSQCHT